MHSLVGNHDSWNKRVLDDVTGELTAGSLLTSSNGAFFGDSVDIWMNIVSVVMTVIEHDRKSHSLV